MIDDLRIGWTVIEEKNRDFKYRPLANTLKKIDDFFMLDQIELSPLEDNIPDVQDTNRRSGEQQHH